MGAAIFVAEASRVQIAWQNPFEADSLFLMKPEHFPGDYSFDPLGYATNKPDAWLRDMKMKELNNGRVAMIAISGMVAQELVEGVNLMPADYVVGVGGPDGLKMLEDAAFSAAANAAAEKAAVALMR